MGTGTSSGRNKAALAAETSKPANGTATSESPFDMYMKRVSAMNDMTGLNDTIERAANDDTLTNAEYQQIYDAAIRKIQTGSYR